MLGNKGSKQFYRSGGTRGGQDQFKWEDVKNDKYRENYLGNSILAPVGRWQQGKDLTWYAKPKTEQEQILHDEKELMRQKDEDLINEKLGLARTKRPRDNNNNNNNNNRLENDEIKRLLSRGSTSDARDDIDIERIKGLGAAPIKRHEHIPKDISSIQKEINAIKNGNNNNNNIINNDNNNIINNDNNINNNNNNNINLNKKTRHDSSSDSSSSDSSNSDNEKTKERKEKKKLKKEMKKSLKKEKKEMKKREKKEKKDSKKEKKEKK